MAGQRSDKVIEYTNEKFRPLIADKADSSSFPSLGRSFGYNGRLPIFIICGLPSRALLHCLSRSYRISKTIWRMFIDGR